MVQVSQPPSAMSGGQTMQIIQHFAENTTLHGAPRIIRSKSVSKRLFWLVVFCSASIMFGFQLTMLLHKYFAHEKRFNFDIRKEAALFPQVGPRGYLLVCERYLL
jgi:hypothetical protein